MAILPDLPGVAVTVFINGKPAKEFDNRESEVVKGEVAQYQASKTVSKFIQSTKN
jgi:hypothetical protein